MQPGVPLRWLADPAKKKNEILKQGNFLCCIVSLQNNQAQANNLKKLKNGSKVRKQEA